MRIFCPECGARAYIKTTNKKHPHLTDLYCACGDLKCGHTYVLNVSYSHTLSPSRKSVDDLLLGFIKTLGMKEQAELVNKLKIGGDCGVK